MSALLPLAGSTWSCHDEIRYAKLRGLLNDNPQYERELMRPKPSAQVVTWVAQQPGTEVFTTSITEAEIFYGIELLGRGKRREGLLAAAEGMFSEDFAGRVFVFDSDAARVFAKIGAARRALGRPISHADAQIAALAQVRGAKLATRNVDDFEGCGIEVVDPWNCQ